MKVLLLANHLNHGGITAYLWNLVCALHGRDGLEYTIASRGGEWAPEFERKGVRHISLPLTTKCEVSPKVLVSFLKLRPLVGRLGIDLLHANTRVTQVLSSFVSHAAKTPYLSTCHGYFRPHWGRKHWPCWGQRVIAISDPVRDHLISDFALEPKHIALIYNGIDQERFKPREASEIAEEKRRLGLSPDKKIIGSIGRLSSVKGQKYLVLAAEELIKRRQDVQFLLIGDGEERAPLLSLIRSKKLERNVVLCPGIKDTALGLSVMDVFVMPSLQEGLGLSILEAQAQGVPVVATRVGGIPTAIEDGRTGLLCPPQESVCLARSIERILNDGALKETLTRHARRQIEEKFSLSLMGQKTRKVYEDILCAK